MNDFTLDGCYDVTTLHCNGELTFASLLQVLYVLSDPVLIALDKLDSILPSGLLHYMSQV